MKKDIIFFFSYEGNEHKGNLVLKKEYNIFTRKSKIIKDFFNWLNEESNKINEEKQEVCFFTNIKIIGL